MAEVYSDVRGFRTLLVKEIRRFVSVIGQTVTAPVVTALLYLVVFAQALQGRMSAYPDVSYTQFLVPGLIMMSILQNAFANTSSSLTQSKFLGNIVFILMSPLSTLELFLAYVLAALLRAALVTVVLIVVTWPFVHFSIARPAVLIVMFALAGGTLAALGMIAGIVATKFDHIAAFQNFVIVPLSFLSGVFYSIHSLPPFWEHASRFNPFFYLIDGFRYGFYGVGDAPVLHSLVWGLGCFLCVSAVCLAMLKSGYRLRA